MKENDRPVGETSSEAPPADEEYARTYAAGYEEGVRSALRELLQHVSRGHTAQELRILVESRLARVAEEVELKRKSLLAPPRRPVWTSLLRSPQPARPWSAPVGSGGGEPTRLSAGRAVLVREERPARAVELVRSAASQFARVAIVSLQPPRLLETAADRRVEIGLAGDAGAGSVRLDPGEIGGRLREPIEAEGGALVYVDALEFLATEFSFEITLRFVNWLVGQVREHRGALVVSFDRRSLDLKDLSRLERAFDVVL